MGSVCSLAYGAHFGRSELRRDVPGFTLSILQPTLHAEDVPLHTHESASLVFVLDGTDLPMLKPPGGGQAVYRSGDLNLAGGAVAATTHTWLPEFFEDHLARPLQFGRYYLNLMPNGEAYMGGGAYLIPRDQLKLGQLYLAGGVWNGQRLVSKDWVDDSTKFHSRFAEDRSLGQKHEYGYGWHLHELRTGGRIYKSFAAEGNGGQFVIVIPALDLVVGITGGAYGEFAQWYRWGLELVPQLIIPAVKDRSDDFPGLHMRTETGQMIVTTPWAGCRNADAFSGSRVHGLCCSPRL